MEEMVEFTKAHGVGNDFIIIDGMDGTISFTPSQVRLLCNRHFGIGADGLIIARPSSRGDAFMLFYNPDGSQAEMCGNGIRCLAKFLYERDIVEKDVMRLETLAGMKRVELIFDGSETTGAKVEMGKPSFKAEDVPTLLRDDEGEAIDVKLQVGKGKVKVSCISMGNPHCVIFVDDVEEAPVKEIGPRIETDKAFSERTNVEFVEILDSNTIKVRVWERGAGETLACGTGACAAAAVACYQKYCRSPVKVELPGGNLIIDFASDGTVYMTGAAENVYNGFLTLEFEDKLERLYTEELKGG